MAIKKPRTPGAHILDTQIHQIAWYPTAQLLHRPIFGHETSGRKSRPHPMDELHGGEILTEILTLQNTVLGCSPSILTIASWGKQLISQILQISHAQWVFCNVSLHDKAAGYLQQLERQKVLQEIDRLAETKPSDIPVSSQYLLEMDFSSS